MEAEKVHITKEMETYLSTLYARALDYRSKNPILGDKISDDMVRRIDFDFDKMGLPRGSEVTLPIRAKLFDRWTREFLAASPAATVLHLGCGLDSRVFRIDPPDTVRWYDVDLPDVIELRRQLFPERHDYQMIGTSVTDLRWLDRIPADRPVLVVAEGLVMYLPESDGIALFNGITEKFPGGEFIFDAMSRLMVRLTNLIISIIPAARKTGISVKWGISDPRKLEKQVPRLKLAAAEPYLTMPGLVERMAAPQRMMAHVLGHIGSIKRLLQYMRFRF